MSPSVFAAPGRFAASWRGTLVVPERDELTFSLEGVGTASLQIDGKAIVSGELPLAATVPTTLAKGAHAIFCSYRSTRNGEGRVRLMWSSPQFRTEPVPASAFRFIPSAELESWTTVRTGREVFVDAQCIRCHQPRQGLPRKTPPELLVFAPDFKNIGNRLTAGWLEQWIAEPREHCPSVAVDQAGDVAAYLATLKDPDWQPAPLPSTAKSVTDGAALVEKLHLAFWTEPLTKARKHTDGGLIEQLTQPARHFSDTVFPDVRLTPSEAGAIAAYIRSKQPVEAAAGRGDVNVGKTVVGASCVVCHEAKPSGFSAPSLEAISRSDWTVKGCVAENRGRAPNLRLTRDEVNALLAFRNADRDAGMGSLRQFAPAEYVAREMKRLNCMQCHVGGGENKLPDITLAGEKFHRDWLTDLFAGKHPGHMRPGMEVRMPAFASRAENLSLGLAARRGVPLKTEAPAPQAELIPIGAKIAGVEGYSCIACHDSGARKATQVFEGQGPNLQLAGERLRYDYFQRWMHHPQRIAPATIMPRYMKDRDTALLDTYFEGNAEKQFDAVWQWINALSQDSPRPTP